MKTRVSIIAVLLLLRFHASAAGSDALSNWPQWRGPLASGASPTADPPLEWSETKNVKWKSPLPGSGTSTPVIWGNQVFILSAVQASKAGDEKFTDSAAAKPAAPADPPARRPGGPGGPGGRPGFGGGQKPTDKFQFVVLCLDRATGKTLWQKTVAEEVPHEGHHPDHGYASASPVTDGEVVLAYFGSRGLHCLDMKGNVKWSKQLGHMITRNSFGEGASPALLGDTVVINWDDESEKDFIAAFDRKTGNELWRKPRSEDTGWATPLIVPNGKKTEVIVNASGKVRSYDLANGNELWSCSGQTPNAIPTPVADQDTVYVTSGFRGAALYAITLGRTGDLAGTDAVRWKFSKGTPYVPSPLLVGNQLYVFSGNNAILSCFDTKKGAPLFEAERLEGIPGIYASPVAAKDRVYVLGRNGNCVVLKQSAKLEILATNKLDDSTDASIALAGRDLFIRGKANLYCIAEK